MALLAPSEAVADRVAVVDAHVEVVDDTDGKRSALCRLFGGQVDGAAEPDIADAVDGKPGTGPFGPGRNPRNVVPVEPIGVAPGFLAAAALSPPVLPRRREARHRGEPIAAMKGEQTPVRIAVETPRRTGRQPRTPLRPAPPPGDKNGRDARRGKR